MTNKEQIITDLGINIERIENSVYKVLNTDKMFNTDILKWKLNEGILLTSTETHYEEDSNGINSILATIYYIITDYNEELAYKYCDKAKEEFGSTFLIDFKYNPNYKESIDTIYSAEELNKI